MRKIIYALLIVTFFLTTMFFGEPSLSKISTAEASFDYNNLISNAAFINLEGINAAGIQSLFVSTGSFLQSYSENGRPAAQIIYDAAHGYGDGSGSMNGITVNATTGTINPVAILATLQKEQGLVTGTYSKTLNQSRLNAAMGYACPDSGGCNPTYTGFTKQIENAAWQLRYNYERAQGTGFPDYQVGQTVTIDGQSVTFSNRATASLYRYTPHLGTNFTTYFNLWSSLYQYQYQSQTPHSVVLSSGESSTFSIDIKNTGSATWTRSAVRLGTSHANDRYSRFKGNDWISGNRISMDQASVATGETATFTFNVTAWGNMTPGTYREYFQPVVDGVGWMSDIGVYYEIIVR